MTTVKLSRRERQKLIHREQMLEAALDLFSERGYHNVSMHEIAEQAEFAIGTLYSFFNNKEDLYKALMMDLSDRFQSALRKAIEAGADEEEKIHNYVQAKGAVFMDNVKMIRLYIAESRGASFNIKAGLDDDIRTSYEKLLKVLADNFQSGIDKGLYRDHGAYLMAVGLDSMLNSALLMWLANPEEHPYPVRSQSFLSIFFEPMRIGGAGGDG